MSQKRKKRIMFYSCYLILSYNLNIFPDEETKVQNGQNNLLKVPELILKYSAGHEPGVSDCIIPCH